MQNLNNIINILKTLWNVTLNVPAFKLSIGDVACVWLGWYVWVHKGSAIMAFLWGGLNGVYQWLF